VRLFAAAALLIVSGCATPPATKKEAETVFAVDPLSASVIEGRVRFTGKAPARKRISMDAEAECAALHRGPVYDEPVVTGEDNGLANALVYIKTGLDGKKFPAAQTVAVIDQKGCQFQPRVLAVQTGQTIAVKNSDPVSHNIHPMPKNNRDWNQQQPPGAEDLKRRFGFAEIMIPVKCNIHQWMRSYVGVLEHPYFQVTGRDGVFRLGNIQPGRYTLAVWHETLGDRSLEIELPASRTVQAEFQFP
jgi:plastocyanin